MLVIFDTETTGFKQNHIVELAAVLFTESGDRYEWYSKCRPSSPIEDGAYTVHGISNAMVANEKPDYEVVAEWWNDIVGLLAPGERLVLAGHNSQFDMRAVRKYVQIPETVPVLCSMKLGRLYSPHSPNHKLTVLHEYLGLTGDYKAHSAMDDVLMSYNIIQHYAQTLGQGYLDLARSQSRPVLLEVMPFGKWQGNLIATIDLRYINYMLGFDDLDPDVKHTFQHEVKRRATDGRASQ